MASSRSVSNVHRVMVVGDGRVSDMINGNEGFYKMIQKRKPTHTGHRKDSPISDNFNWDKSTDLSQRKLKDVKKQLKRDVEEAIKYKRKHGIPLTPPASDFLTPATPSAQPDNTNNDPDPHDNIDFSDEKFASQMLADLRKAYRSATGLKKLKDMMKDDKNFAYFVKELLRVETMAKLARKDSGSGGGIAAFVVIKGLEESKQLQSMMDNYEDPMIKKQVDRLMDPEGAIPLTEEDENEGERDNEGDSGSDDGSDLEADELENTNETEGDSVDLPDGNETGKVGEEGVGDADEKNGREGEGVDDW